MPSVSQEPQQQTLLSAGKRRRRDDPDPETHLHLYDQTPSEPNSGSVLTLSSSIRRNDAPLYHHHNHHQNHHTTTSPRRIHAVAKRIRLVEDRDHQPHDHDKQLPARYPYHNSNSNNNNSNTQRPLLQQADPNSRPQLARSATTPAALLAPCHICHRKPTKRTDLDSFADCEGCEQRTCFVCMRKCLGWRPDDNGKLEEHSDRPPEHGSGRDRADDVVDENSRSFHMEDAPDETGCGSESSEDRRWEKPGWACGRVGHRPMICSRCCVEKGPDGEVVCLGCLPFVEG